MAKWLDTAVFYEIYPQSFQDTNADGIGDFQGIIRRLDYIKELGCDAIWINPCFNPLSGTRAMTWRIITLSRPDTAPTRT